MIKKKSCLFQYQYLQYTPVGKKQCEHQNRHQKEKAQLFLSEEFKLRIC